MPGFIFGMKADMHVYFSTLDKTDYLCTLCKPHHWQKPMYLKYTCTLNFDPEKIIIKISAMLQLSTA